MVSNLSACSVFIFSISSAFFFSCAFFSSVVSNLSTYSLYFFRLGFVLVIFFLSHSHVISHTFSHNAPIIIHSSHHPIEDHIDAIVIAVTYLTISHTNLVHLVGAISFFFAITFFTIFGASLEASTKSLNPGIMFLSIAFIVSLSRCNIFFAALSFVSRFLSYKSFMAHRLSFISEYH